MWYEIDSVLGHGGFGITYLATDTNLNQKVAIKEYFPSNIAIRTDDNRVAPASAKKAETYSWGLSRFLTEAQTLAKFRHSGIVQVFSVFEANGSAYMVMEFVRGESLGDRLKSKTLVGEAELLRILYPLLDGLQLMHDAGFIHRDIKPDNIFLREDGSPVLLDFGSARLAIGSLTQTLTMLVSPGYAPFEQYSSSQSGSGRQGPWTDLYSLGATLYMAVSGRGPVDSIARATATIAEHADPLLPVIDVGKGRYSEQFLVAIDKALAVQPHERPQSIEEWKRWLPPPAGESSATTATATRAPAATSIWTQPPPTRPRPVTEDPEPTAMLPPAPPPRGLGPAAIVSSLAIAALVGAGLFFWLDHERVDAPPVDTPPAAKAPPTEPPPPPPPADEGKNRAPPTTPEATPRQRIEALLARANEALTAGRLSLPTGHNALDYFREVLAVEPDNEPATTGIRRVMMGHLAFALHALKQNDFAEARRHLQVAESIDARAREVVSAKKQLETAELVANQRLAAERARAKRVAELMSQAETARGAGRLAPPDADNAADALGAVLELDPGHVDARRALAEIARELLAQAGAATSAGQFDQARKRLQAAAAIDRALPGIDAARATLAAAEQAEQRRQAEERARRARIDDLLASAGAAMRAGRLAPPASDSALEKYRAVLELDADNATAREGIGAVVARYLQAATKAVAAGDFAAARERIEAARAIDGNAPGLDAALAQLNAAEQAAAEQARRQRIDQLLAQAGAALDAGRLSPPAADSALERFRAVLALDRDNQKARDGVDQVVQAHLRLALQAGDGEDFERARSELDAAARIDASAATLAVARRRIADAARARDERDAAERARLVRIEKLLAAAAAALADGRLTAPAADNALGHYRAVEAIDAGNAAARDGLGRLAKALLARGREAVGSEQLDSAREDFDAVASIDPATSGLAAARTRLAAAETAVEQRLAAEQARAKHVEQLLQAASRALAAGRLSAPDDDNAADRYREVLSLDPANAAARKGIVEILESHLARGRAAVSAGDLDGAEADFDAVARIDRNAGGLADARRRLDEARQELARQQAEAERQRIREEQARVEAERQRQQAKREEAARRQAEADKARREAERQRAEAERQRIEAERQQAEAARRLADQRKRDEEARRQAEADKAQREAERQRVEAERQRAEAERQRAEAERQQAEAAQRLAEQRRREEEARRLAEQRDQATRRQARIRELLDAGARALAATRLTTPAGDNALEAYRGVLELDAGNGDARRGIEEIIGRYRDLAEAALSRDRPDLADEYLARAIDVDSRSPRLATMREMIVQYRTREQARQADDRKGAELQRLLADADAALAAGRLDSPAGASAIDHYRAALAVAPDSTDARRGLSAVAERLVELARRAIASERWSTARRHLQSASAADPALRAIGETSMALVEANARSERALAARTLPQPAPQTEPKAEPRVAPEPRLAAQRSPDIMGKWCGTNLSIEFTADRWIFSLPDGHRTSYRISSYSNGDNGLTIRWVDERRQRMVTEFGRFSQDGQSMIQLRGKREDEEGWHRYNRRFTRC